MMIDPVYATAERWARARDVRVTRGVSSRHRLEATAWIRPFMMTFRLSITLPCNS